MFVAVDTSGNTTIARLDPALRVIDPADVTPPVIQITSPAPGDIVTYLTDVVGSVTDDNLEFYEIQVSPFGADNFTTVHTNTFQPGPGGPGITDDLLGVFDPTLLANDIYDVRVVAQDVSGNVSTLTTPISIEGGAKLGNFRIELTDLAIPLAGIPIQINRVYDTLDSPYNGDFGYGWKLDVAGGRIRESVRISESEANGGGIFGANPFRTGTRVYMNAPDGRRVGFTFDPVPEPQLLGTLWRPRFTADPGVYHTLEVEDIPLSQNPDGTFGLYLLGFAYNPDSYTLVTKDQLRYTFDQFEDIELTSIEDRNNVTLTFDDTGIHSSTGPEITWTRNDQGQITEILDTSGNPLTYTYTSSGDLESFEDQVGNVTSMTYLDDPGHYLESITDPRGIQVLSLGYDEEGRLTGEGDALGNSTARVYDLANNTEVISDRLGNETTLVFDDRGNITEERDPLGFSTFFQYDINDNEIAITNKRGFTTDFEYDDRGNITKITDALDGEMFMTFNSTNDVTSITDELGRTTEYVYDASGNLNEVIDTLGNSMFQTFDLEGRVSTRTDRNNNTLVFEYTSGCACPNTPSKITYPDLTTNEFTYDNLGQQLTHKNELGVVTASVVYDDSGRTLTTTLADGQTATNVFNGALLASQTVMINNTDSQVTSFEYDANGRIIRQTDSNNGVVELKYDVRGNILSLTDAMLNTTSYEYDPLNRRTSDTDALGNESTFLYDGLGNLIEQTDRLGRRIETVFDEINRPIAELWYAVDDSLVEEQSFNYDAKGNMTNASDSNSTYTFTYDLLDRVSSSSNAGTADAPTVILSYEYDDNSNRTSVSDDSGVTINSEYGSRNQLLSQTWLGGEVDDARVEFTYNAALQNTHVHRYGDTAGIAEIGQTEIEYDDSARPTRITHSNAVDQVIANYEYDFDFANRITNQIVDDESVAYTYDPTGQLLAADHSALGDESYAYDLNGNRIDSHLHGTNYITGPNNQLLSDGDFTYEYDLQGNQIRRTEIASGEVTDYEYDHRNRLVAVVVTNSAGEITSEGAFVFDVFGRRIAAISDLDGDGPEISTRENFVYDGHNVWADFDDVGDTIARYLFGNEVDDNIARWTTSEGTAWYLTDYLGSVRSVVDSSGTVIASAVYDSFGRLLGSVNESGLGRYRFTGRESTQFGFQYSRSRTYTADTGRFGGVDSIGFAGSDSNLYAYVFNSPTNFSDPLGNAAVVEYVQSFIYSGLAGAGCYVASAYLFGGGNLSWEGLIFATVAGGIGGVLGTGIASIRISGAISGIAKPGGVGVLSRALNDSAFEAGIGTSVGVAVGSEAGPDGPSQSLGQTVFNVGCAAVTGAGGAL